MPYKDPEVRRAFDIERSRKMIEFLRDYKVKKGCADCGYNEHHAGLEFDHVYGKVQNVSKMGRYGKERVMEEVAKCDVVCGTCHNIRTFNRKHGG
jgi:hypothetical protein